MIVTRRFLACPTMLSLPSAFVFSSQESGATFFDRLKNIRDHVIARLRAEIAFAVHAKTHSVGFHVAVADNQHGVDFHLLGALDLAVNFVGRSVELGADFMRTKVVQNGP
jgi:hypothetical protein